MADKPRDDFGRQLQELEDITARLEQNDLDLDRSLKDYERGVKLVAKLKEQLRLARNRVEVIEQELVQESEPEPTEEGQLPF